MPRPLQDCFYFYWPRAVVAGATHKGPESSWCKVVFKCGHHACLENMTINKTISKAILFVCSNLQNQFLINQKVEFF